MDGVGQLLTTAERLVQTDINTPAVAAGQAVYTRILHFQQYGQRNAILIFSIAVLVCFVEPLGSLSEGVVADHRQHIHPQVEAEGLCELRERLLALLGQFIRAQHLCFIIDNAVVPRGKRRGAEGQGEQEDHDKQQNSFLHIRSPPSHMNKSASAELSAERGMAMAANRPQNLPQLTGRSPTSLPVCPFMAKRKSLPFHLVFSIQTGIRA